MMKNTKYPAYVVITDRLTTLGDLQTKARAIDRIIVRWEKLKRKTQIIQCHRCQKWSHAATNCNVTIVALRNATMAIGRSRRPRGPTYARGANRSQFEDPELAVNARHLAARRAHPAFKFFLRRSFRKRKVSI
jgi:hypothetical protein